MKRSVMVVAMPVAWAGFSDAALAGDHGHHHKAELGKNAPNFTLADLDGKEHSLSDYSGKVVVLEWTNYQCPFVVRHQKELKTMQKTREKFDGQDVVWLAIDSTRPDHRGGHTVGTIKSWAKHDDVKLPYPVLVDPDGKVGRMYGAKTTPHMFVIDQNGTLVYHGAIDDDAPGSRPNARNHVEAAVKSTLAGSTVEIAATQPYGCSVKYKGR
jgi:peroxiredoxin